MTIIAISESSSQKVETLGLDARSINEAGLLWKKKLGLSSPAFQLSRTLGGDVLRTDQVVGVIRVRDAVIEIFPKFLDEVDRASWHSSFLNLVRYAHGRVGRSSDDVPARLSPAGNFAEVVGLFFNDEMKRGFARGFPRCYRERNGLSSVPEGSLDLANLNSIVLFDGKIAFRSPYLSRKSSLSALIGWAAGRLATLCTDPGLVSELNEWHKRLGTYEVGRPPTNWSHISIPRSFEYLRPLVEIAQLLASGAIPGVEFAKANLGVTGFLWRTADVYERAVYRLNAEALDGSGVRVSKRSYPLLSSNGSTIVKTIPDFVFSRRGVSVLVGDAKYKTRGSGPETADVYQVIAAADVTGCPKSMLYYPSEGLQVRMKSLDVSGFGQARQIAVVDIGLNCFARKESLNAAKASLRDIFVGLLSNEQIPAH